MKQYLVITVLVVMVVVWTGSGFGGSRGLSLTILQSERGNIVRVADYPLYKDYQALIIGIDEYRNGWPVLSNGVKDARRIAKVLEQYGVEVELLLNPTSGELKRKLEEFYIIKGSSEETGLILWYAGHGHTEGGEGYLVPVDAPQPSKLTMFKFKALSLRRFGEYVRLANAKHAIAVFDACFAGTIFNTQRAFPPSAITLSTTRPVRQFISAGDADQSVSDDGTFASLFIQALEGRTQADANSDGYLTGTELGLFLSDRLTNLTQSMQTPRYGKIRDPKYDQGDFVFQLHLTINAPESKITVVPSGQKPGRNEELVFWETVKGSDAPEEYQAYLEKYPDGLFSSIANVRLMKLKKSVVAQKHPTVGQIPEMEKTTSNRKRKSGDRYTDPDTGMQFVFVEGGCFKMGCTPGAAMQPLAAHDAAIKPWQWPLYIAAAVLPVGCARQPKPLSYYDQTGCHKNELPVHEVCVDDFYISKYELTTGEYRRVLGKSLKEFPNGDNYPVSRVNWYEAKTFIRALNKTRPGKFRLPTEAEWEFAARSGGRSVSADFQHLQASTWNVINSGGMAHPVGTKAANSIGIHDMTGNVREWCEDFYGRVYYRKSPRDNPEGPLDGNSRIVRGGGWNDPPEKSSVVFRYDSMEVNSNDYTGFRLVMPLE